VDLFATEFLPFPQFRFSISLPRQTIPHDVQASILDHLSKSYSANVTCVINFQFLNHIHRIRFQFYYFTAQLTHSFILTIDLGMILV